MSLDRRDYKTSIPQLESRLSAIEQVGKKGLANFDVLEDLIKKEILERERLYLKQDTSINTITVKMYYVVKDYGVTPTTDDAGWAETMPKMDYSNDDKVLWYMTKTFRNGAVIETSTPQQVQLMDGVFSFINSVSGDAGWTTINGDTISTGRIQDHTGDNYFDLDDGTFNFGDGTNYIRQLGNGVEIKGTLSVDSTVGTTTLGDMVDDMSDFAQDVIDINNDIDDLQNQIDGNITTWFYGYVPTLSNAPASSWSTDTDKDNHLGDLFYDTTTGYAYRFMKENNTYSWAKITDSDVTEALRLAGEAQDTADHKRRVFVSTPTPPYDIGDLWAEGSSGDIKKCKTAKADGQSYSASDWELASKYTDDTAVTNFASRFSVTPEAISSEVTATQDGNTLTTRINQNATTVKIQASKVEVDGTLIVGASDVDNAINDIDVGSRNLLIGSNYLDDKINEYSSATLTKTSGVTVSDWSATDATRISGTGGTSEIVAIAYGLANYIAQTPMTQTIGETYSFSVYVKNNHVSNAIRVRPNGSSSAGSTAYKTVNAGEAKLLTWTWTASTASNIQFNIATSTAGDAFNVTLWHPMYVVGNKITGWNPAPEDNEDYSRPNLIRSVENYDVTVTLYANTSYTYNRRNGSLIVTATAAGSGFKQVYVTDSVYNPSQYVGKTLTFSCSAITPSKSTLVPRLSVYANVNGTYTTLATILKDTTGLKESFIVPSGTTQMGIIYRIDQNTAEVANDYCYFNKVKLEAGATATNWIPEYTDANSTATSYITEINDNGIYISPSSQTPSSGTEGNSVKIDGTGMEVFKGSTSVAKYGDTARIGKNESGSSRTEIGTSGMQIIQNVNGTDTQIANLGYGYGKDSGGSDVKAPYYTFGTRKSGSAIGNYSVAEGRDVTASGYRSHAEGSDTTASKPDSHAEGSNTTASGNVSHAEGSYTTASGVYSHAEGYLTNATREQAHAEGRNTTASGENSHAEGYSTTASGTYSHAEGSNTTASGYYSHAQNYNTIASGYSQTAIGRYNEEDASSNYALIIGNGSADNDRSNALTVSWNGNIRAGVETPTIDITTSTGTLNAKNIRRFGHVVQLHLQLRTSASTASGGNLYTGTISTTALRPLILATGVTYYGAYTVTGTITSAGEIVVRNSNPSAISATGTSNINVVFTYIVA